MHRSTLLIRYAVGCTLFLSVCVAASAQTVSDRLLVHLPASGNPLFELIAVKVEGEAVRPDQYFPAGDGWLRGLTFTLKNVSNQPILWAGVELSFRDPVNPGVRRVLYRIQHKRVGRGSGGALRVNVQPGESFEVAVTDEDYQNLERLLRKAGLGAGVHRLEFRLEGALAE